MSSRSPYTGALHPVFPGNGNGSHPLSSSLSSLGSVSSRNGGQQHSYSRHNNNNNNLHSSNHVSSGISRTYRQASTLFLTRRLPEALTTLLPLISPPSSDDDGADSSNYSQHGDMDGSNGNGIGIDSARPAAVVQPAPIASTSRTTRVKVWSLYLTILNAIVELEPDEGKEAFGGQDWRAICTKVRSGDVWEEVVRNGYHGAEGDVDADVVINLATLLLAHAQSQALNQKRLENYLSFSHMPNLDLSGRFDASLLNRSLSRHRSPAKGSASGAATPRDLNARIKILELYTLHVLLRNDEWDYAREFISASPLLDEERREAFLLALESLHEEQHEAERRAHEEKLHQEELLQRDLEEARRIRAQNEEREQQRIDEQWDQRRRQGSDFGGSAGGASSSGHQRRNTPAYRTSRTAPPDAARRTAARGDDALHPSRPSPRPGPGASAYTSSPAGLSPTTNPKHPPTTPRARDKGKGKGKAVVLPPPASLATRTALLFSNLRGLVEQMSRAFQASPISLMRTLLFIVTLLIILGKKNIRERVSRILGSGWNKVKATAGMGVKVSYI